MDDGAAEETVAVVERAREALPERVAGGRVVFGFDGYVDRVREVVADRQDPEHYDRLPTLAAYRDRVADSVAADSSLSFEWLQTGTRTGGHTSHLARAFGTWGFDPVMIGTYGQPQLDVFEAEFGDCERFSLGEPGYTDAVEFDDGKLMLTEIGDTVTIDWATLTERVPRETLADRLDGARLLGVGYWSETPDLPDVLEGLARALSDLADSPGYVLLDPGDVRKLDRERLRRGQDAIGRLDDVVDVVVSANRAETRLLADTFGEGRAANDDPDAETGADADPDADAGPGADADAETDAAVVYEALAPSVVVCHGVARSVAVSSAGTTSVAVPAVDDPALTTSSGDHFNAGLALALIEGLDPGPAVAVGNAVAGAFVRSGEPPSLDAVRSFLEGYEGHFDVD